MNLKFEKRDISRAREGSSISAFVFTVSVNPIKSLLVKSSKSDDSKTAKANW